MIGSVSRVAQGERREIFGAAATLGLLMAAHALLETARDTLFLRSLPPSALPWVYLVIAALAFGISRYERRASAKAGRRGVLPLLLVASAIVTGALWFFADRAERWLLVVLYVWGAVYATVNTVRFWLALSARHTVTEAKRLFGVVGAGGIAGAIVGSLAARIVAEYGDARHMLLFAAAFMAIAAPVAFRVLGLRNPIAQEESESYRSLGEDIRAVRASRYLTRLAVLVTVATVASTIAGFIFKREVAREVAAEDLGVFFSTIYLGTNLASLTVQLAAVGWLLDRFGAQRVLTILPALLLLGGGLFAVGGGLAAAVLLQVSDGTLKHSMNRTAIEVLYVPLPQRLRGAGKAVADVLGMRGGQAIGSVAILLLLLLPNEYRGLSLALIAFSAVWIFAATSFRRHYLELFRRTLTEHTMSEATAPLDKRSLEAVFAALNSPRDERVLAAVDLLAAHHKPHLIPALILHHPSPAVVLKCLDLFAASGDPGFVPVAMRLLSHPNGEIRTAALRAVTTVAPDTEVLEEAATDDTPEVRVTAIVYLSASGKMPAAQAMSLLAPFIEAGSDSVRGAAARALAACPAPGLAELLERLASDSSVAVRAEAIAAIGKIGGERFLRVLLGALAERRLREGARQALVTMGEPAFRALTDALEDDALPLRARLHVPRSLSRFESERAAKVLLERLEIEERSAIKYKILRALGHLRLRNPQLVLDAGVLHRIIRSTLEEGRTLQGWSVALHAGARRPSRDTPAGALLRELVDDEIQQLVEHVFRLLSLAYQKEDYRRIHRCLSSGSKTIRAGALELLASSLSSRYRDSLLGIIPGEPLAARLERLGLRAPPAYEEVLGQIMHGARGTISAFAVYHAAELHLKDLRASVERASRIRTDDWSDILESARRIVRGSRETAP